MSTTFDRGGMKSLSHKYSILIISCKEVRLFLNEIIPIDIKLIRNC